MCREHCDRQAPQLKLVAVLELQVDARSACKRRSGQRSGARSQAPRAGDVVRVDVGLEDVAELEAELPHERDVSIDLAIDRIDQRGLLRDRIRDQVGVGRGVFVEQLAQEHREGP